MTESTSGNWVDVVASRYAESTGEPAAERAESGDRISPYDLPAAVRSRMNKGTNKFVVDLKYITDDRLRRYEASKHVMLWLGELSHRLYKIELDAAALRNTGTATKLWDALKDFYRKHPASVSEDNYDAVSRVLGDHFKHLFAQSDFHSTLAKRQEAGTQTREPKP